MAIDINFGALQTANPFGAFLQGQEAGQQRRLRQAQYTAGNLFATDPTQAAAVLAPYDIQSAAALSNLGYQQQLRGVEMKGLQRLFGGNGATQTAPAAPAPTDASAQGDTSGQGFDPAAAAQRVEHFDTTAQLLQSIPYGPERKAALQQAAPDLAKNGIPADQITSFDPTDENLAAFRSSLADAAAKIGVPTSSAQPAAPQPAAQPSPSASGSTPIDLRDPNTVGAIASIGIGNPQLGSFLTNLGTASMPKFAPGRKGAPIIDERTGETTGYSPDEHGITYVKDPTSPTGWKAVQVPGFAEADANYQAGVTGAKTKAEEAAKAPYTMVHTSDNGVPVDITLDKFKSLKGSGQAPGLGQGLSPGAVENQKADAGNFAKEVDTHGASAVVASQNARTVTQQAINLAQNINPNAWTASAGRIANVLNAAGFKVAAPAANNISTYQALLPQVLRGTFTTFPRLDKEFEIVKSAAANVNTPKDAATILLATQASIQGRNLAYANFVQNWNGPPSKQAMTRAFLNSPAGNASIFADPIWRNLTIGGSPAVMVGAKPLPDGHIYGVFRPGTPYAQTFMVQ